MGLSVWYFSLSDLIILNLVCVPAARGGGCHMRDAIKVWLGL